MNDNPSKLLL